MDWICRYSDGVRESKGWEETWPKICKDKVEKSRKKKKKNCLSSEGAMAAVSVERATPSCFVCRS